MREFCPRKQGASRGPGPNLLILNKGAIASSSLLTPFGSNRERDTHLKTKLARILVIYFYLGCRKWGCNKWGFKGCLAALPGNRPKSGFFSLFLPFLPFSGLPFSEGPNSTWKIQKTEEKGLFPQISSDFLKPPYLKPPFAAPQSTVAHILRSK